MKMDRGIEKLSAGVFLGMMRADEGGGGGGSVFVRTMKRYSPPIYILV